MFKGIKKIVRRMGQSIRKMKFIKRTLISCTLGFAAVLGGAIVFETSTTGGLLTVVSSSASAWPPASLSSTRTTSIGWLPTPRVVRVRRPLRSRLKARLFPRKKNRSKLLLRKSREPSAMSSPPLAQTPTTGICPRKNSGTKPHQKRLPSGGRRFVLLSSGLTNHR